VFPCRLTCKRNRQRGQEPEVFRIVDDHEGWRPTVRALVREQLAPAMAGRNRLTRDLYLWQVLIIQMVLPLARKQEQVIRIAKVVEALKRIEPAIERRSSSGRRDPQRLGFPR
jgi:hypothetical protein